MIKYIAEKAQALYDLCAGEHKSVQPLYSAAAIALDSFPAPDKLTQWFQALCVILLSRQMEKAISNKLNKQKLLFWKDFFKKKCYLINSRTLLTAFCKIDTLLKKTTSRHHCKPWIPLCGGLKILSARDSDQCSLLKTDCSHGG